MPYRLDITARLQQQMLDIVGTALPLIARSRADADLVGLAHLRGEMIQLMDAYCRHIHALDAGGVLPAEQGRKLVAGCNDLRAAYEAFRARWVHRDSTQNWYEYRLSAVVMMKQVRAVVQQAEAAGRGLASNAA